MGSHAISGETEESPHAGQIPIGEEIEHNESLSALAEAFLADDEQARLVDLLTQLDITPINAVTGIPLLDRLATTWRRKALVSALVALGIALIPVVLAWREGNLVNTKLHPDLLHDYAYWTVLTVGLPLWLFTLVHFLACLPLAIIQLCLSKTISITRAHLKTFTERANTVFGHKLFKYPPIAIGIVVGNILFYEFVTGDQDTWYSPKLAWPITAAGWTYVPLSFLAAYVIVLGVFRVAASYVVLSRLFGLGRANIQPLHPDGRGGVGPLGALCMKLNIVVFVFGLITVSGIIGSVRNFGLELTDPVCIGIALSYVIGATVVFFLPLYATHTQMARAKYRTVRIINQRFEVANKQLLATLAKSGELSRELEEELERLRRVYDVANAMPVYPFNTKVVSSFVGSLLVPIIILLLSNWIG